MDVLCTYETQAQAKVFICGACHDVCDGVMCVMCMCVCVMCVYMRVCVCVCVCVCAGSYVPIRRPGT
jgi:hypothetical protein